MNKLWLNTKTGFAFKVWWGNLTTIPWTTLRNELNPSWWVKFDGWFGPSMVQEAIYGWCGLHLAVAVGLAVLGVNVWQMALIAFGLEVFQFIKARGEFIFPINSLLDIGSYCLWVYLYIKYVGWSVF